MVSAYTMLLLHSMNMTIFFKFIFYLIQYKVQYDGGPWCKTAL